MEVEMEEDRSLFVVVVVVVVVAVVVRFIAVSGWEKGGRESESGVGYEKVGGCVVRVRSTVACREVLAEPETIGDKIN